MRYITHTTPKPVDLSVPVSKEVKAFIEHARHMKGGVSAAQVARWAIDEYRRTHFPEWVYVA